MQAKNGHPMQDASQIALQLTPTVLLVVGSLIAIVSAVITSLFNVWIQRQARLSDERKHHKEMIINAAVENWRQTVEISKNNANANGVTEFIAPFDEYLLHMAIFSDVVFSVNLKKANITEMLNQVVDRTNEVSQFYKVQLVKDLSE